MSSFKRLSALNKEIERLHAEKKRIEKQFEGLNDEQYFATILHDHICKHNHVDGCSWEYEKWDNVNRTHAKKEYLATARNGIAKGYTPDEFIKFYEVFFE